MFHLLIVSDSHMQNILRPSASDISFHSHAHIRYILWGQMDRYASSAQSTSTSLLSTVDYHELIGRRGLHAVQRSRQLCLYASGLWQAAVFPMQLCRLRFQRMVARLLRP
mmetsp:Transcript_109711/g.212419  ORF Transcript_109711/g.212419 Transcript_109711/m.212419 type:complete len:110 (-) Transcript_109711:2440-2769(-)